MSILKEEVSHRTGTQHNTNTQLHQNKAASGKLLTQTGPRRMTNCENTALAQGLQQTAKK